MYIPKSIAYKMGYFMEILGKLFPFYPFRGKEIGSPIFSRKTVDWVTNDKYVCSTNKLKKLGFNPSVPLQQGIKNTLSWYKKKNLLK